MCEISATVCTAEFNLSSAVPPGSTFTLNSVIQRSSIGGCLLFLASFWYITIPGSGFTESTTLTTHINWHNHLLKMTLLVLIEDGGIVQLSQLINSTACGNVP